MLEEVGRELLKVAFAGVGAVAVVAEKACAVGKVLVQKGEETVEQGKAVNADLQARAREAAKERRAERLENDVESMNAEEREALKRRLAELDELEREVEEAAKAVEDANITEIHCERHNDED